MGLVKIFSAYKYKNNKLFYYLKNGFKYYLVPNYCYRLLLDKKLKALSKFNSNYIFKRVNYYNQLSSTSIGPNAIEIGKINIKNSNSSYFFDAYQYLSFFDLNLKANFLFGDITFVPNNPSLLKSRPIHKNNINSVILNLDKIRHFNFIYDRKSFETKRNMLVWRGDVSETKPGRIEFLQKYNNHLRCNVGYTNNWGKHREWAREKMTIPEQLDYKFILCLEGIDVATNLKWVMSSNSLPVMPKPRYETWFMEGTLIPGVHYVQIKDDFSDLEEQMDYYINNPSEALKIVENGHEYVNQFKNRKRENLISLLVLKKYFEKTGQL